LREQIEPNRQPWAIGWIYSGLIVIAAMLSEIFIYRSMCGSEYSVCSAATGTINGPLFYVVSRLNAGLGHLLGIRQIAPDFYTAPRGVELFLRSTLWFSLLAYWFALGVVAWWIYRAIQQRMNPIELG
jgi:hypothetical protein